MPTAETVRTASPLLRRQGRYSIVPAGPEPYEPDGPFRTISGFSPIDSPMIQNDNASADWPGMPARPQSSTAGWPGVSMSLRFLLRFLFQRTGPRMERERSGQFRSGRLIF